MGPARVPLDGRALLRLPPRGAALHPVQRAPLPRRIAGLRGKLRPVPALHPPVARDRRALRARRPQDHDHLHASRLPRHGSHRADTAAHGMVHRRALEGPRGPSEKCGGRGGGRNLERGGEDRASSSAGCTLGIRIRSAIKADVIPSGVSHSPVPGVSHSTAGCIPLDCRVFPTRLAGVSHSPVSGASRVHLTHPLRSL
ncbi:hypothetical protein C8R44DRAFT_862782 [Mycena epipterygia]|nr:hypothetical protein C8R44DRAFT_862782 [Mycena epipterygia]